MTTDKDTKANIETLRTELKQLHEQKEELYAKKRSLSEEVGKLIESIKDRRSQRDGLTEGVQSAKKRRRELNQTIRTKIEQAKELQQQKQKMPSGKSATKVPNPTKLLADIKRLQYKIETEGVNFDVEQRLMKQIKEKESQYEDSKQFKDVFKDLRHLSKEIDELKAESDKIHEDIQAKAVQSQEFHESMIETSKKIDELKEQERDAAKSFQTKKDAYTDLSKQLRESMQAAGMISEQVRQKSPVSHAEDKEAEKKRKKAIKAHESEVRSKIAKGGTLTTEDLYILQNMSDEDIGMDESDEEKPAEEKTEADEKKE